MAIFSTMFKVKKELTKDEMIRLALEWVNGSPHYDFDQLSWDGNDLMEVKTDKQTFSIISSNDNHLLAIRLENVDENNVIWTSDFVLEEGEDDNLLVVRLTRDAMDRESGITNKYNRPRLMKTVLKKGYGGFDNGISIDGKPVTITSDNIEMIEKIINGDSEYNLPVVFVTRRFSDNEAALDVEELAIDLAGVAHVMVEDDTHVTMELKERTNGENPFSGAVHIYYTDKIGARIIPDYNENANVFRFKIRNMVCKRVALVRIPEKYTWSSIKYQKLYDKYLKDRKENSELEETFEYILNAKEKEHKQYVDEMEKELFELRSKAQSYEYSLQMKKSEQKGNVSIECSESEFYENEIKDMILKILKKEKEQMDEDVNLQERRRYHVLKGIVESNEIVGNGDILERELKDILSATQRIGKREKKKLKDLGFKIEGQGHNKLFFHGDKRYFITIGKTPSDHHAGANAASIAINTIVC